MYQVLDKDTINREIVPFLPDPKRGMKTKCEKAEIVNCILYKFKTGCQWHMLPIECLFSGVALHYKTVFGYFRTWCKSELWQHIWSRLLDSYRGCIGYVQRCFRR
jgi:transposase